MHMEHEMGKVHFLQMHGGAAAGSPPPFMDAVCWRNGLSHHEFCFHSKYVLFLYAVIFIFHLSAMFVKKPAEVLESPFG